MFDRGNECRLPSMPQGTNGTAFQSGSVIVVLGAGASVEAGVPTAAALTSLFSNFHRYFEDDDAPVIENLFRHLQLVIAQAEGKAASDVDFESVLGMLTDLASRQAMASTLASDGQPLGLTDALGADRTQDILARLVRVMAELLSTRTGHDPYLKSLIALREPGGPLDVFTLNFDLVFEEMLKQQRIRYVDGFRVPRAAKGLAIWDPSEFDRSGQSVRLFKLHGSLDWAVLQSGSRPSSNAVPSELDTYLRAYRRLVRLNSWRSAEVGLPGSSLGSSMAINVGTRKELMYTATPFNELFHRFVGSLAVARVCIIAGYSFRDERVNQVLEEAVVERRGELRLVVVDPAVFRVADSFSSLWQFSRSEVTAPGIAALINAPLGQALQDGLVKKAVREAKRLSPGNVPSTWGTAVAIPSLPTSPERDALLIGRWWLRLRANFDGLALRERLLGDRVRAETDNGAISDSCVADVILPMVTLVAEAMSNLDSVLASMSFGPYFGKPRTDAIRIQPQCKGPSESPAVVSEAISELRRWVDVAFRKYHYSSAEFMSGIADPEYKIASAPDNFSMCELVLRGVRDGIDEVLSCLNDTLTKMGYEPPFPVPAEAQ